MDTKQRTELQKVRQWAHDKLKAGSEPPWAWYQYMKLIEAIDAIDAGSAVTTTESSRQLEAHSERRLQLVEATSGQDTSLHRPVEPKVRLPM